jgi:hypothetical protein
MLQALGFDQGFEYKLGHGAPAYIAVTDKQDPHLT